ncbi:MAG: hypothetical protein ACT4TC_21945 [Myxococcaceae bacterium]
MSARIICALVVVAATTGCTAAIRQITGLQLAHDEAPETDQPSAEQPQASGRETSHHAGPVTSAERTNPEEQSHQEARRLVKRASDNATNCFGSESENAVRDLRRAMELWSEVPRARLFLAIHAFNCSSGGVREICTPPDPNAKRLTEPLPLLEEEVRLHPDDEDATRALSDLKAEIDRAKRLSTTYDEFTKRAERIAAKRGMFEELPPAAVIVRNLAKAKDGYMLFCRSEVGADVENYDWSEKETRFELWSDRGRYLVVGPPHPAGFSGPLKLSGLHVFGKVEGVFRGLSEAGVPLVIPRIRALMLYYEEEGVLSK